MRIVLLCCAVLTLAACGQALDPTTGIAVAVRRGPIAPVAQPGVDNTAPVAGASVAVLRAGQLFTTATTDSAGTAAVPAPSGTYEVALTTCPGAISLPGPVSVTVIAGMLVPAQLECDTGIR